VTVAAIPGETLRIAYDVTPMISGRTGIARYVSELGLALEQQGVDLRRFAVGRATFPAPAGTARLRMPARVMERWWALGLGPRAERLTGAADVLHATGGLLPPTRRPLVVTVHDLDAIRHPELHPPRHIRAQREMLGQLQHAAVVIAVSGTTADHLAQTGFDPSRIVVAPLGVTPARLSGGQPPGPDRAWSERPYVLTVGETSPRKGYGLLLHALAEVDADLTLVMVGPAAADENRLQALIDTPALRDRVWRLGMVSDSELASLYQDAVALCFPSVSEGFGLPVLEAMAAGVPVLASDIPVIREVAADAAVLLPRDDVSAWATAISSIAEDEQLRERLGSAGRERAAGFTWERTAKATLVAYRRAVS